MEIKDSSRRDFLTLQTFFLVNSFEFLYSITVAISHFCT